ncbi:MAG: hypothetical protein IT373_38030 [Polyangiaceae bacterium]|nr:hypothetical protein [Polyangiaceae bacterium]
MAAAAASVAIGRSARADVPPGPAAEAARAAELLALGDAEAAAEARAGAGEPTPAPAPDAPAVPAAVPAPVPAPPRPSAVLRVAHAPGGATLAFGDGAPGPIHGRYVVEPGTVDLVLRLPGERARRRTITLERDREHAIDLARLEHWDLDPPPQPVSFVRRPLTQPDETLSVEAGVYVARQPRMMLRDSYLMAGNAWDVRFGILDDLELELAMSFMMYLPSDTLVGVRGRLLDGDLELALSGQLRPPLFFWLLGTGLPGAYLGLDALGHLGPYVRLDTGVGVGALFRVWRRGQESPDDGLPIKRGGLVGLIRPSSVVQGFDVTAEPGIPLSFTFAPVEELALRIGTGVGMVDFEVPSSLFLPLEARLGVTAPYHGAPAVDVEAKFAFPFLFAPVVGPPEDSWQEQWRDSRRVLPEWWQVTLAVRVQAELGN